MSGCVGHLDLTLTATDRFLYQKLRCHLAIEQKTRFSSDDFRALGLEKFLHGDTAHALGRVFAVWKHHHLIQEVGVTRSMILSNHLRRIPLYEFGDNQK
jgi:hypothetical protein